jgi:hypothetical protein
MAVSLAGLHPAFDHEAAFERFGGHGGQLLLDV